MYSSKWVKPAAGIISIAIDANNHIYSAYPTGDGIIRLHDQAGNVISDPFISGVGGFNTAANLTVGPGGGWGNDLYAIAGGDIHRIDINTAQSSVIASGFGTGMGRQTNRGITFGPDGAMYVSADINSSIHRIIPEPNAVLICIASITALSCRPRHHGKRGHDRNAARLLGNE